MAEARRQRLTTTLIRGAARARNVTEDGDFNTATRLGRHHTVLQCTGSGVRNCRGLLQGATTQGPQSKAAAHSVRWAPSNRHTGES